MNWWDIAGAAFTVVVVGGGALWILTARTPVMAGVDEYRADERLWASLQRQGEGVPAQAVVLRLTRPANRLKTSGRDAYSVAAVDLQLSFQDQAGLAHEVHVSTFIEGDLLTDFSVGKTVAIVYSKDDPRIVAIDRGRTLLEIPSTPPR